MLPSVVKIAPLVQFNQRLCSSIYRITLVSTNMYYGVIGSRLKIATRSWPIDAPNPFSSSDDLRQKWYLTPRASSRRNSPRKPLQDSFRDASLPVLPRPTTTNIPGSSRRSSECPWTPRMWENVKDVTDWKNVWYRSQSDDKFWVEKLHTKRKAIPSVLNASKTNFRRNDSKKKSHLLTYFILLCWCT